MGFLDRLKEALGGAAAKRRRERAAVEEAVESAPGGGVPPMSQRAPEPDPSAAQKGSAATGVGTGDPVPDSVTHSDPAAQSASAEQTPEEQREAAASDPAASSEPGSEGQGQEPR
jgi:hypothetical protein